MTPQTVYVLTRAAPVGQATSEFLEVFTDLERAQLFLFQVKPMLEPERYEWRLSPFDGGRWLLYDLVPLTETAWTIVAKRLIGAPDA